MARRSLIWQIYPAYLLVIVAALIAVTWYSTHFFHKFYLRQTADSLHTLAILDAQTAVLLMQSSNGIEIDKFCKDIGKASKTRVTVITPSGKVLGDSHENPEAMENHSDRPEFIKALQNGSGQSIRFSHTLGRNMMYVAVPLKHDDQTVGFIRTAVSLSAIEEVLGNIYFKIASTGIVVALIAAALSFMISRHISRPAKQIEQIARQFEEGHLNCRVPIPNILEFAGLAKTLNEMARQLQNRINTIIQQQNESEAILSSMTEGILAVDVKERIVSINKAAACLFNLEPERARGRNVEEIIRNNELQQFIKSAFDSDLPIQKDIILHTDKERSFQLHGTSIPDKNGNRNGAVIVFNDVTEMRKLENIRRDFVANVSHELRTPITSIKGFVETLLEGAVTEPLQAKHFLEIISRHVDRLNAIIEDLLSLSQLEDTQSKRDIILRKEPLKPILEAAVELSSIKADQKQITVNLICPEDLEANANSLLLEQAIFNLLDNAIKFSEPGSAIQLTAELTDKDILISVRDSGCGIKQKHLERIFERFYVVDKSRSRKLGGTGLGLSIVKHIVQLHKGNVTVSSSAGKGSTFAIHLPKN